MLHGCAHWLVVVALAQLGCSGTGEIEGGDVADAPASPDEAGRPDTERLFDVDVPEDTPRPDGGAVADAAPVAPAKVVLSFTWKGQETGYWCGPGSTRIALSTRLSGSALPTQASLASELGTTTAGTDHIGLVAGALNRHFGTKRYVSVDVHDPPTAAQREKLKDDIVALVGAGWPLVANVVSGFRPPGYPSGTIYHYVAIVGFDAAGEKVLVADPAGAGAAGGAWAAVPQSYWVSIGDLAIWIGAKGYTGR